MIRAHEWVPSRELGIIAGDWFACRYCREVLLRNELNRGFACPSRPTSTAMIRQHEWVSAREVGLNRDWTVCRNCGFILRGDRANEAAACKGRVRVELRESPDTQPAVDLTPRAAA